MNKSVKVIIVRRFLGLSKQSHMVSDMNWYSNKWTNKRIYNNADNLHNLYWMFLITAFITNRSKIKIKIEWFFIQENAIENVVCSMVNILSHP